MPLKWISSSPAPEAPKIILAAPGSVSPRQRLTQVLAASSLLAASAQPLPELLPRAPASGYVVINNLDSGAGSLRQAVQDSNNHPGSDTISFAPQVSGTITLTSSQLLITDSVQIMGPGPGKLSLSGNNAGRVFYLYTPPSNPFTITISGLTIRDGFGPQGGGAILDCGANLVLDDMDIFSNTSSASKVSNGGGVYFRPLVFLPKIALTIRNSMITGNHANNGGGIAVGLAGGGVDIENTQIVSNTALFKGGGVYLYDPGQTNIQNVTIAGNSAAEGGGLMVEHTLGGLYFVRGATIAGNTAAKGAGINIFNLDDPFTIENSTVSGNHATDVGGGIYLYHPGRYFYLFNSTVADNTAGNAGGGLSAAQASPPIANSIVAGNLAPLNSDLTGTFQLRYDLVQITGSATISDLGGNLFGLDPLLGPLSDHGGPTETRFPAHNSPVIDAGDPAFAEPPSTDQRGSPRRVGRLDMGAVEAGTKVLLPLIRR